mmetsp:Transcript_79805/g.222157  ORF Transcript_79805/g.222157 Transcript_79805/m.222157 type:complete len:694 (-) Transcript_79805:169-2250(-)
MAVFLSIFTLAVVLSAHAWMGIAERSVVPDGDENGLGDNTVSMLQTSLLVLTEPVKDDAHAYAKRLVAGWSHPLFADSRRDRRRFTVFPSFAAAGQCAGPFDEVVGATRSAMQEVGRAVSEAAEASVQIGVGAAEVTAQGGANAARRGVQAGADAAKATGAATQEIVGSGVVAAKGVVPVAEATAGAIMNVTEATRDAALGVALGVVALPGEVPEGEAVTLGGNSREDINIFVCLVVFSMTAAAACTVAIQKYFPLWMPAAGSQSAFTISILGASYALLVPGVINVLVSFNIVITVFDRRLSFTKDPFGKPGAQVESLVSLTRMLWHEGSVVGASFLVLFAVLVPVLKLILLILGERWRHSDDAARVQAARSSIITVQHLSKWASPDMFAYILVMYLIRGLDSPPVIFAPAQLDVGFVCFGVFCVVSTLSSNAIPLPKVPVPEAAAVPGEAEPAAPVLGVAAGGGKPNVAFLRGSTAMLRFVILGLGLCFTTLMVIGVSAPVMSLQLETATLMGETPLLPLLKPLLQPKIDRAIVDMASKVQADVSLTHCMLELVHWSSTKMDLVSAFAFAMIAIFVVFLPMLNMALLVAAGFKLIGAAASGDKLEPRVASALKAAQRMKHIEMLDVLIVGVVLVRYVGRVFASQGFSILLPEGLFVLLAAEAVHYTMYYVVLHHVSPPGQWLDDFKGAPGQK